MRKFLNWFFGFEDETEDFSSDVRLVTIIQMGNATYRISAIPTNSTGE